MMGVKVDDFVRCSDKVWRSPEAAHEFEQARAGILETHSHVTRGARLPYIEARARGEAAKREEARAVRLSGGDDFPAEPAGGEYEDWM